jgi:hypothetical protein
MWRFRPLISATPIASFVVKAAYRDGTADGEEVVKRSVAMGNASACSISTSRLRSLVTVFHRLRTCVSQASFC